MKKIITIIFVLFVFSISACDAQSLLPYGQNVSSGTSTSYQSSISMDYALTDVQKTITQRAFEQYPAPILQYFIERKTLYDWAIRWNKPDVICYTYFFIGNTCIGYFISHGKPASCQNYLIPEDYKGYTNGGQSIDIDGTYGQNNPGYRFFLANGTAVEVSGSLVSCVYSDAPLSIEAKEIKQIKRE